MTTFLQIDAPALLGGTLAALVCALAGNFLVLSRQSMAGDAMSHVVLPGVVLAFVLAGTSATGAMILGAAAAVAVAGLLVEGLKRAGIEPSTALGVVFTAMFAAGVLLLAQTGAGRTTFDVHSVLLGNVEAMIWPAASGPASLFDAAALAELPPALLRLVFGVVVVAAAVALLFKELRLATFDPVFARTIGLGPGWTSLVVTGLAAFAAVMSLEAVGVILTVAMFVCPPATARLLTNDLRRQVLLSGLIAAATGITGYLVAAFGPALFGATIALNAAGTIALVSALGLAAVAATTGRRRAAA